MEYNIIIPENHPEREQLRKVAKTLLEFLPLHSIYFSLGNKEFSPETIITLFLSKEFEIDATDVKPFIDRVFSSYPQFRYTVFEQWIAAQLFEEGTLYFILHATKDELAYSSQPKNKIYSLKKIKAKKLIRNAEHEYYIFSAWAENCFSYVTWYGKYEDYLQAAFHLHQALKYTFQKVALLLMGEYLASESLEEQQRYVADFYPVFGKVFDLEKEDELNAIRELDNSCRVVRHNRKNYTFTKEAVELATAKTEQISAEAYTIFKAYIAKCNTKIKTVKKGINLENK